MSTKKKRVALPAARAVAAPGSAAAAVAELRRLGSKATRDGMARYGLPSDAAFGVPVGTLRQLAKRLGQNQELALELWATAHYEARLLAIFVADPEQVTPALMDRWCRDFDNWAVCDTACFHLFDRVPHALGKVAAWARRQPEFEKRAAFALLASAALHDKGGDDELYAVCFPLIEGAATDERNFVKKAVSWALKGLGGRGPELHAAALDLAQRLARAEDATARWIGKDALRDLARPATLKRVAKAAEKRRTAAGTKKKTVKKKRPG
jgi:3-methyladenine DNA glycosylase AlkD